MAASAPFLPESVRAVVARLRNDLENMPHTRRISDTDAEALYAVAHRDFVRAHYAEALGHFQVLLVYRPTHCVYLLGAALCLQRLRRYPLAVLAFSGLCLLEPDNPAHALALAECQLLCPDPASARETLTQLLASCQDQPGHERVHARAQAMLDLMRAAA